MSTRITRRADGTARGQTQQNTANSIIDLRKPPANAPRQAEPAKPACGGRPQRRRQPRGRLGGG